MAFTELVSNYYRAWFRFHPELAVNVGEAGYEDLLTPYSDDDIGALITLNESLLSSLQELDMEELSAEEKTDFNILYSATANELHDLLENDWRYQNPEAYLPINAIHQLLTRPVNNFHAAVKHRLQAIPAYLRGAKTLIRQQPEKIPPVWLASAIAQGKAGIDFLLNLDQHPVVLKRFDNPRRLHEFSEEASAAVRDFVSFLEKDIQPLAKGEFACGRKKFDRLLKEVHFLELDADQLHVFGQNLFNQTRQQLDELLNGQSLTEALSQIKSNAPDTLHLLDNYRQSINNALDFIRKNDLLTIPESQHLSVVETPAFLKHEIPFAAYDDPVRNDPEQHGYYYVTVPENDEGFEEHNITSIDLTSVHEAYPGHHLQFSVANTTDNANSLVRVLNATSTFYEGWALYCEEMMVEQGYLNMPEHKIVMLRDRLWRALRIMIDVEIQTRGLSLDEAAKKLCDELGFEPDQAKGELNWYSFAPTVPMSYAIGWALIRSMREVMEATPGFSIKQFHDNLLSAGSVALPLVMKARFGDAAWKIVSKELLENSETA